MRCEKGKKLFLAIITAVIIASMCINVQVQAQEIDEDTLKTDVEMIEEEIESTEQEKTEEETEQLTESEEATDTEKTQNGQIKDIQPQAAESGETIEDDKDKVNALNSDTEQEDEEENIPWYVPWILGRETDGSGNIIWPEGVSYDDGTNTLTLNNVVLEMNEENRQWEFISYKGDRDLVIKLLGKNIFKGTENDIWNENGIWAHVWSQADLYITGGGSLELQNGGLIWNQSYNTNAGNLHVDGVTLISDGEGFMSQYSNITIKNATIDINNKGDKADGQYEGRTFGICTGQTEGNDSDVTDEDWDKFGGLLTIENSNIRIKNCTYPIAANKIKLNGCNLYGGNASLEYRMDPNRVYLSHKYNNGFERIYYEDEYMVISTQDLEFPDAYYLYKAYDSNDMSDCYIALPVFAGAGQTVNVQVYLETGYRLKHLYINGDMISGTSFVMPAKDTTVKAVFEKTGGGQRNTPVSKINVSGISKKIAAGKKIKLSAEVSPSNASNKTVAWTSKNPKVATVDSSGVVTMNKKSGGKSVTITATAADGSGVSAAYKITSMKGVVKKVAISGKKTVKAGKTLKLKAKVTATKKANKKLKWTSNNNQYATVSGSGKVKTMKAGKGKKVKITAMATDGSGKKKVVTIKIK